MWTCHVDIVHTRIFQAERERKREREAHIESGYPPRHYLLPATPRSCFRSSHTFIPPSTQCLDHGGIFPHLMTSVVIHSSWTAPPFHGLRRGQRSSLFQTRPFTNFACRFGGQHLPGFPSLPFHRPETQRTPKTTTNSWFQGIVSLPSQFPLSERAGAPLLSLPQDHIFISFVSSEKHYFFAFLSQVFADLAAPLWLLDEAYQVLNRVIASGLSITQKPRVSSDPLHKDHHAYPHAFSCHRAQIRGTQE